MSKRVVERSHRFMELEGLRGIAAIVVAVYHFALAFYILAYFGPRIANPMQHTALESILYANPLGGFISGTFAVAIFFVLSGFVLSIGFFQTGRADILRKLAAKRYLRLMLPALASVLLSYFLIKLGMSHTQAAAEVTGSMWLADNWRFVPHLGEAISQGVTGIFMSMITPIPHAYNNVLWTMATEFVGSFIVFIGLLLFGKSRYRWYLYGALLLLTFNTWLLGFIIGMILADLYCQGFFVEKRRHWLVITATILGSVYLGGYPFDGPDLSRTSYGFISLPSFDSLNHQMLAVTLGAALLVVGVLTTKQLGSFMRHKHLSRIGKYTFSLYLVHLPILYSVTTGMFVMFHHVMGYNKAVVLSVILSIPIVWGVTVVFERYIDAKAVVLSSYFADVYFGKRSLNIRGRFVWLFRSCVRRAATVRSRVAIYVRGSRQEIDSETE